MTVTNAMMVLMGIVTICVVAIVYGVMADVTWIAITGTIVGLFVLVLVYAIADAMSIGI